MTLHPSDRKALLAIQSIIFCKFLQRHSWMIFNAPPDPAIGLCERCGVRREWPD